MTLNDSVEHVSLLLREPLVELLDNRVVFVFADEFDDAVWRGVWVGFHSDLMIR